MRRFFEKHGNWIVALLLALATVLVFWSAVHCPFSVYDDPDYVVANRHVQRGVVWDDVVWAFSSGYAANWHPLTWISHMLDFEIYGMNPAGHHATNVILHGLNAALLFLVLRRMKISLGASAVMASVFAWHPLRVESVAWISERKDVLSMFFGLVAAWFYVGCVTADIGSRLRRLQKSATLFCFVLALLAKPMFVTLPVLLFLLDIWPLNRFVGGDEGLHPGVTAFGKSSVRDLVLEKLPFLLISAVVSVVTVVVQKAGGAVASANDWGVGSRLENAAVATVTYLRKMVWPTDLAIYYPHLDHIPAWQVIASALVVIGISIFCIRLFRRAPALAIGWLWFLIALSPVIGIIQVGGAAMADRYSYLPMIGVLFIGYHVFRTLPSRLSTIISVLLLPICIGATQYQLEFWQDNVALFSHALSLTGSNYVANGNMADALVQERRFPEALDYYAECMRVSSKDWYLHYQVASTLLEVAQTNAALQQYEIALALGSRQPKPRNGYGTLLAKLGRTDEAIVQFREAMRFAPDYPNAAINLAAVLADRGQLAESQKLLEDALSLAVDDFDARLNLANVLLREGKKNEALVQYGLAIRSNPTNAIPRLWAGRLLVEHDPIAALHNWQEAIRFNPDMPAAYSDLAWLLATHRDGAIRNGKRALELAQRACELTSFQDIKSLSALDVSYAECGKFQDAITTAEKARKIADQHLKTEIASAIDSRIGLYRAGRPYRQ